MIKGTSADDITKVLKEKIPHTARVKVKEITLDMAASMNLIAKNSFPKAMIVTDRFHVQKLAYDALQDIRIKYRWSAIEEDNNLYLKARKNKKRYTPKILANGDTHKQLLARSRYILFKSQSKWTHKQKERAEILFENYPEIEKAYKLVMQLGAIYENTTTPSIALTRFAHWFRNVELSGFKNFATVMRSFQQHYASISNFFINRSTNAAAESFNAKIKEFRRSFRGVTDLNFFLFRLTKIYA